MSKTAIFGLGIVGLLLIVGISGCSFVVGTVNRDNRIRNQFRANEQKVGLVYDEMWKDISQKTQLSDEYKASLVEVTKAVVEGRKGGALFKSTQEAMPGVDSSIIKEVMATVEGKRHELTEIQSTLLQLQKEDNDLRSNFPTSLVLSGREELQVKLITSSRTERVRESGRDDDVSLRGDGGKK